MSVKKENECLKKLRHAIYLCEVDCSETYDPVSLGNMNRYDSCKRNCGEKFAENKKQCKREKPVQTVIKHYYK